jgi:taurine dehydrogenase large subunit
LQRVERHDGAYLLRTPGGTVRAAAVGIATGAYTLLGLTPELGGRCMPILSNSLVTRPLTQAEIDATGFRTRQVITDTRTLRFYYRLLPDNRLQIGSRSAITGADAAHDRHLQLLIGGLHRKFPPLEGIAIYYSWWGWVDVSHDMMPRIFRPDAKQTLVDALGYGGNGVSYSAQAGRRMAQMLAGKTFKRPRATYLHLPAPDASLRAIPTSGSTHALSLVSSAR